MHEKRPGRRWTGSIRMAMLLDKSSRNMFGTVACGLVRLNVLTCIVIPVLSRESLSKAS